MARLPDGSWSAPSAIGLGGFGGGGLIGIDLTDFVFVLNSDKDVATFIESATLTIGLNASVAAGPGRSVETSFIVGSRGIASQYAYSKTFGLYVGVTAEMGVLFEMPITNKKIYERKLKAKQLLNGDIPPPREADSLMHILNSDKLRPDKSDRSLQGFELAADDLQPGPAEVSGQERPHELPVPQPPQEMAFGEVYELHTQARH